MKIFKATGKYISGKGVFHTGWKGRRDALKWLITGKPPLPHIEVPVTVGPVEVSVMGGGEEMTTHDRIREAVWEQSWREVLAESCGNLDHANYEACKAGYEKGWNAARAAMAEELVGEIEELGGIGTGKVLIYRDSVIATIRAAGGK